MFNLTKLALLWDWVNVLKKDSADVHGDLAALDSSVDALEVTAPKDYSTTETATGQKWINGKDVYMKVISDTFPEITSNTNVTILTDTTIEDIISCEFNFDTTAQIYFANNNVVFTRSSGTLYIASVGSTFSEKKYNAVILYTKVTPSRAPEDPEETPEETKKTTKKKTTK